MTIKTKYNINDKVYLMVDNRIERGTIYKIIVNVSDLDVRHLKTVVSVKYLLTVSIEMNSVFLEEWEEKVFKNKEELIQSLLK